MAETAAARPQPAALPAERTGRTLRGTPVRELLLGLLHLAALAALGIAQPLLNLLGKYPAFFAAHDSTSLEVVGFGLFVVLVPPLVLWGFEILIALISTQAYRITHLIFVAFLAAIFFLQIVKRLDTPALVFLVAALLGIGLAALYARSEIVRTLLTFLALAPVLFLVLFLFGAPVSKIVTGGTAQASALSGGTRPPIVVVMFDAFPVRTLEKNAGVIDPKRYPSLASLAKDGRWYRNATTAHENTTYSVPAILDGNWPRKNAQPIVQDHPQNLFTLLGRSYEVNVQEEATNLCPTGLCRKTTKQTWRARMKLLGEDVSVVYQYLSLPKSMQEQLPPIGDRWQGFRRRDSASGGGGVPGEKGVIAELSNGGRPARMRQAIAAIRNNTAKPQLNFMHVLLPHEPRQYLPDLRQYQSGADPDPSLDGPPSYNDQFLSDQSYQREMLQVQFTDHMVGEVIARLKQQKMYDKSMVIIVSDHGESFKRKSTPGGSFTPGKLTWRRAITKSNFEDIAPVPLFIKYPKGKGPTGVDGRWVKTIDIFPTVADELGVKLKTPVDGRSLLSRSYTGRPDVTVERSNGQRLRMSIPELERRKAEILAYQQGLFGTGSRSLYRIGPNPQLIGRRVSAVGTTPAGGLRATLIDAGSYRNLNPDAAVVPTHIKGRISGGSAAGRDVAVALNGEVVGVGRTFASLGDRKLNFAVLIPDSKLRRGRNKLEVYEVKGGRLARLGGVG
jgi:hypothetical protein